MKIRSKTLLKIVGAFFGCISLILLAGSDYDNHFGFGSKSKKLKEKLDLINELRKRKESTTLQSALLASTSHKFIKGTKIPAIIHQTWKTKDFENGEITIATTKWKKLAKNHLYLLWDDNDVASFIKTMYPKLNQMFFELPVILRADLFRYLVVYEFGGIYSDIDTVPLKPLESWIRPLESWKTSDTEQMSKRDSISDEDQFKDISFIVGLEIDLPRNFEESVLEYAGWVYPMQLCQWTFAASPRYPFLGNLIDSIIKNIKREKIAKRPSNMFVLNVTGPGAWTRAIYESWKESGFDPNDFREFGSSPKIIKDQLILPLTAFNPGMFWDFLGSSMGSMNVTHPNSLVQNLYHGSWKK